MTSHSCRSLISVLLLPIEHERSVDGKIYEDKNPGHLSSDLRPLRRQVRQAVR